MKLLKINWPIPVFIIIVAIFFYQISKGLFPIPSDTIIGLYHPFRDLYTKDYPNGIPFKNFLITDPVRQQYPWRELSIAVLKRAELPLWNPYSMAGYPLLGSGQSASLYPLNILLFVLPFSWAWSILIFLQPLLAGVFLYFYLRNLHLHVFASLVGSIAFSFSGFFIAWLEWGTILHSAVWLPLILLSIDKILFTFKTQKISNCKWPIIFIFSLASSLFAGHLQTFFYVFMLSLVYIIARWWQHGKNAKPMMLFIVCCLLFVAITAIQWVPTLQFIGESARSIDLDWQKEGWFIPWQHLIQFVAPDFFGNPTTLNYWGAWNYGEFIGYIGIFPLLMAVFSLFARRDKKTLFFGSLFFISLIFALPTFIAKIPYQLGIPFLVTAQPTRLLFVTDLSLAILSALGFDLFLKNQKKAWHPLALVGTTLIGLWLFVWLGRDVVSAENLEVANRNLRLPTALFAIATILLIAFIKLWRKKTFASMIYIIIFARKYNASSLMLCIIMAITVFDLLRFGWKFTPFTNKEYLFPNTRVIEFLQSQEEQFRIMTTDKRILPPNFSTIYRIQTVDGYDPLYLRRFGELIAASERGRPDISPPFGFNRIITPQNYDSKIIDLLGVRYVLSLSELSSPKLTKVFEEGQTRVYENKNAISRAFFVEGVYVSINENESIRKMFEEDTDLRKLAIVESGLSKNVSGGKVVIVDYAENRVSIATNNEEDGFLVLTDTFYPTWRAKVDEVETKIYRTDYNFRGIFVPKGRHTVIFYNSLL